MTTIPIVEPQWITGLTKGNLLADSEVFWTGCILYYPQVIAAAPSTRTKSVRYAQ